LRYKAIIFDVADTLVYYRPNLSKIYGDKVRSLGLEVTEEAARKMNIAIYRTYGEMLLKVLNGMPRETGEETDTNWNRAALSCVEYDATMEGVYLQSMSEMEKVKQEKCVIPGVFETLDYLTGKYRLAIVSNYSKSIMGKLKELGLYRYFEAVIVSEIVGVEKPDTRIMEIALNELNLRPSDCLYVGDHPLDILCSKKAGMDCAWVIGDWEGLDDSIPFREDYRIKNVAELMRLL